MYAVQFVMNVNTVRRRRAAVIHPAGNLSPSGCDRFCTVFVGSDEFHVLRGRTENGEEKEKLDIFRV